MRFLAAVGLLAILVGIAAAAYFFGEFYSVAGTQAQSDIVAKALVFVRDASIDRHAVEMAPSSLDDPTTVQAGARAFLARGCANCHGGPGVDWAKFSEGLHPDPPGLKDVAKELDARQIFWVIKNGIDMTGMPAFGPLGAADSEIWSIAAFVKKLPSVSDADFKAWTAPAAGQ